MSVIATLEIRHHKYEMLLNVNAEVAGKVRTKMVELNEGGMYPNEEIFSGKLSTQFIISGGYNWNSRWRDFKIILDQVLGIHGMEVVVALRKIGVSYAYGHTTECPGCNSPLKVRNLKGGAILPQVTCSSCGEVFEIVIPEDPYRQLTQDDFSRITHAERRDRVRLFYNDNPDVISCYTAQRNS